MAILPKGLDINIGGAMRETKVTVNLVDYRSYNVRLKIAEVFIRLAFWILQAGSTEIKK